MAEIDQKGYGILTGYVSACELAPIQAVAHAVVKASGDEYTGYSGAQAFTGTVLDALPDSIGAPLWPVERVRSSQAAVFEFVDGQPEHTLGAGAHVGS